MLLQYAFQRRYTYVPSSGHFAHKRCQVGEAIASPVGQDSWRCNLIHLGFHTMELDKAGVNVLRGKAVQGIFDQTAVLVLDAGDVSERDPWFAMTLTYLVIIYQNHDGRVCGNFLHSVEVARGIYSDQCTVFALTGTLAPSPKVLTSIGKLFQPICPPPSHEIVLVVIRRNVGAWALLFREVEA